MQMKANAHKFEVIVCEEQLFRIRVLKLVTNQTALMVRKSKNKSLIREIVNPINIGDELSFCRISPLMNRIFLCNETSN